jgi:hypothetical protein
MLELRSAPPEPFFEAAVKVILNTAFEKKKSLLMPIYRSVRTIQMILA